MISIDNIPRKGDFVLGIDIGTSSVKVSLVHIGTKAIVEPICKPTKANVSHPYNSTIKENVQDPVKILKKLEQCVKGFPAQALERVKHVAICGQMHGVMLWKDGLTWNMSAQETIKVNEDNCSTLYTWQDQRCSTEFIASLPKPDSSLRISTGYGCATLLWLQKKRPRELVKYDRAGTIMDFVTTILTNCSRVTMSDQNAASWGFFNTQTGDWNHDILQGQGLDHQYLPQVASCGTSVGQLCWPWCGVPKGAKIYVATGDMQSAFRASTGDDASSVAVLGINTSAQLSFLTDKSGSEINGANSNGPIEHVPYQDNQAVAVSACLNGGNVLSVFVETLQQWMISLGCQALSQDHIWTKVVELESTPPPTNPDQLTVCPRIYGERHEPEIRGQVLNLTAQNLDLKSVVHGLCGGIVANISSMMSPKVLQENGITKILASGECLRRHPALQQAIIKEYVGCQVQFVQEGHACVGAALFVLDHMKDE